MNCTISLVHTNYESTLISLDSNIIYDLNSPLFPVKAELGFRSSLVRTNQSLPRINGAKALDVFKYTKCSVLIMNLLTDWLVSMNLQTDWQNVHSLGIVRPNTIYGCQ